MTPPPLRQMTAADVPAILALERALFGDEAWSRQMLEGELAQQPASRHYLVAGHGPVVGDTTVGDTTVANTMLSDTVGSNTMASNTVGSDCTARGAIVGYGGLLAAGGQADVLTLAVAREHWGEGIGSVLLAALLAEARRRSCAEVFLEVRVDNARAQALYRRHGFGQVGIRKGYYQPSGADALVMRRDLCRSGEGDG